MLIVFRGGIANIIIGSIILISSIIKIVIANDKVAILKKELFTLLLGLFILLFGIGSIVEIVRYIAASLIIIFAIYNLYLAYKEYKEAKEKDNILEADFKESKE